MLGALDQWVSDQLEFYPQFRISYRLIPHENCLSIDRSLDLNKVDCTVPPVEIIEGTLGNYEFVSLRDR